MSENNIYFEEGAAKLPSYNQIKLYNNEYKLCLQRANAVILYPSFSCPAVLALEQPLEIWLLINKGLADCYNLGKEKTHNSDNSCASKIFLRRINMQLRYSEWDFSDCKNSYEIKDIFSKNKKLFDFDYLNDNNTIAVTKPVKIAKNKNLEQINQSNDFIANIPYSAIEHYLQDELEYFVKIIIKDHPLSLNSDNKSLYNLTWISIEDEKSSTNILSPFEERQDRLMQLAFKNYGLNFTHAFEVKSKEFSFSIDKNSPLISYHPVFVIDKEKLGIGHLTDVHVSSRQELFKKSNRRVINSIDEKFSPKIGDMVHSCFDSFKDLLDQMGENSDVDVLFITGDLVDFSYNIDPLKIKNYFSDIDDNVIWELMRLKRNNKNSKANGEKEGIGFYETHSKGIDIIIVYSLLKYYYDKYKKPIFVTSGNHDSYKYPYGISPRVAALITEIPDNVKTILPDNLKKNSTDKLKEISYDKSISKKGKGIEDYAKANDVIPLDHNLTFYEAILMFGPGYNNILTLNNFDRNINKILFHIFSPITDFSFTYKKQVITGLYWGDDESIISNIIKRNGSLPRANASISEIQKVILSSACKKAGFNKDNILFWHATLVNYDYDIPMQANDLKSERSKAIFASYDELKLFSKYDVGSFLRHKYWFFDNFIGNGCLTHTFSGHSHRFGLYQCIGYYHEHHIVEDSEWVGNFLQEEQNQRDNINERAIIVTRGFNLENNVKINIDEKFDTPILGNYRLHNSRLAYNRDTRIIVSSSCGPIANKNTFGELSCKGLDNPSGTILAYNNGKEYLSKISARTKNSTPRFAVLLDAIDILGNPVFQEFEYNVLTKEFYLLISPKINYFKKLNETKNDKFYCLDFIDKIILIVEEKHHTYHHELKIIEKNIIIKKHNIEQMQYKLKDTSNYDIYRHAKNHVNAKFYMSVFLKQIEDLKDTYNFNSNWNILVTLYLDMYKVDMVKIERHRKFGEIPNFSQI